MKEFEINKQNEGQRFDKYLMRIVGGGGSSFVFKMLRKKNFVLNEKKATGKEILKDGDIVKLYISDDTYEKFKTINVKNDLFDSHINIDKFKTWIIYEDKDIILINKPYNILSQKAKNNDVSINEYVLEYLYSKNEMSDEMLSSYRPSCVNRLDRNTTGIIIAAKNLKAAQALSKCLKDRTIEKYYKCYVYGDFNKEGLYKAYLSKNEKENIVKITDNKMNIDDEYIETEYTLANSGINEDSISEVMVHLITGKSHQIRAHISYLGFPIIGDTKYGNKEINKKYKAKHQLLHAYKIVFPNFDEKYNFEFSNKTFINEPNFRY